VNLILVNNTLQGVLVKCCGSWTFVDSIRGGWDPQGPMEDPREMMGSTKARSKTPEAPAYKLKTTAHFQTPEHTLHHEQKVTPKYQTFSRQPLLESHSQIPEAPADKPKTKAHFQTTEPAANSYQRYCNCQSKLCLFYCPCHRLIVNLKCPLLNTRITSR
jgi:hypothetical protein